MRKWARWFLGASALLATVVIVTPPLLYLRHRSTRREIERHWEALRRKYPPDDGNESARVLAGLGKDLALDLAARRRGSEARPSPRPPAGGPARPQSPYEAIGQYLTEVKGAPGEDIPEPPVAVADQLAARRAALDRVIAHLAAEPALRWPLDIAAADGYEVSGNDWIALRSLLNARLVTDEKRGAHGDAQRALQATWHLGRALTERPDTLGRILGQALVSDVLRLSTKMSGLASSWDRRLAELDPYQYEEEDLDLNSLVMTTLLRAEAAPKEGGWLLRLAAEDTAIAARRTARDFVGRPPCSIAPGLLTRRVRERLAFWNRIGPFMVGDLDKHREGEDRLLAQAELARKVIDLKARRDAAGGAWPASVPGIESSACTGAHWTYSLAADGRTTLAFSRAFEDTPPLTFSAGPRPLH